MMKLYKKLIVGSVLFAFFFPFITFGQAAEQSFGGLHIATLNEAVCDCGGNSYWILDYKTNTLLMLYYSAGRSVLYSNYNLSGTYQLGTYSYDSQPCRIYVYEDCVDIQNIGTYGLLPGTGTTLTKAGGPGVNALFQPFKPSGQNAQVSYFAALKNTSKGILRGLSF